jgi:hypothetical protein
VGSFNLLALLKRNNDTTNKQTEVPNKSESAALSRVESGFHTKSPRLRKTPKPSDTIDFIGPKEFTLEFGSKVMKT